MKRLLPSLILTILLTAAGCNLHARKLSADNAKAGVSEEQSVSIMTKPEPLDKISGSAGVLAGRGQQGQQPPANQVPVIPAKPGLSEAESATIDRKIIRNAELKIETDTPDESQRKIALIAEKHKGFVITSESRQNDVPSQPAMIVNIVVRVPAAQFTNAIEEILGTNGRVLHKRISGQDVTEEYLDLEARIRAKKALENQFLEIMKRAGKVSEALEVQTQLSEVRAEIERMEGRRRFLENQASLSTITISLQTPAPLVAATTRGFWYEIRSAFGDGFDTALAIILEMIRFVIAALPVLLLLVLPAWFILRVFRNKKKEA